MTTTWLDEVFGVKKPIISMLHLQPLPGDPDYDKEGGMDKIVECARRDLHALQNGGVDGLIFSNEFSLPYQTTVPTVTVSSMAYVIGALKDEIKIPYGVNCLWDPDASLDLAVATGAQYIREIVSGVYASDFGLWNTHAGDTARHRIMVGAQNVRMFYNIVPESAVYLGGRDIGEIAKSTEFNHKPDAMCVSGMHAGVSTDTQVLKKAKDNVKHTPIFANTGCNKDNIATQLTVADGAIVATTFKKDGIFENAVDENRVKEFMAVVKEFRKTL